MTVSTAIKMPSRIKKIAKLKSLDEALTRSGQAINAFREQRSGGTAVPSDEEFARLIDSDYWGTRPMIAESLWQDFFRRSRDHFFVSFNEESDSFVSQFGQARADAIIKKANAIVDGRIDLLGLRGVSVGKNVDWHREPISLKRSPIVHWREFEELDCSETGDKKLLWEMNRHQHFFTLGVAFRLTGDERYGRTFAEHLDSWMGQNPPSLGINWLSSLEVSFRAISWIWAFNLFRDSDHFTPELFRRGIKYLYLHGRHIERYLSKYYSPNTHLTGEGLGLYYLGTQLPFLSRAAAWRKIGGDILSTEIETQVLKDGTYFEQSTWYQRYTADFYLHYLVLKQLSDEPYLDAGLARIESRLGPLFDQMAAMQMPDGTTPMIGDDDGGRMLPLTGEPSNDHRGTLAVGAVLLNRGDLAMLSDRAGEESYWLLGGEGMKRFSALEPVEPAFNAKAFADGGYFMMRDGWSGADSAMLIDCGDLGALSAGHGHADALSITAAVHGRTLLVDSGTYTYHESKEMRDYFRSTRAHNTLEVDGASSSEPASTFSWNSRADADWRQWVDDERFTLFHGSHNGYERLESPVTHHRSVLGIRGEYWIIRDLAETTGEHDYALNFHYAAGIKPAIGGPSHIGDAGHRLYTFGDNGNWEQRESWTSTNHAAKVNTPFFRFVSRGIGDQEFFSFLLPCVNGAEPPTVEEIASPVGRAFMIRQATATDLFIFNDSNGEVADAGSFSSDFKYTWARFSNEAEQPDELILIDGSCLTFNRHEVFTEPTASAVIRRLGVDLYIRTDKLRRKKRIGFVERRHADRRGSGNDRRGRS